MNEQQLEELKNIIRQEIIDNLYIEADSCGDEVNVKLYWYNPPYRSSKISQSTFYISNS